MSEPARLEFRRELRHEVEPKVEVLIVAPEALWNGGPIGMRSVSLFPRNDEVTAEVVPRYSWCVTGDDGARDAAYAVLNAHDFGRPIDAHELRTLAESAIRAGVAKTGQNPYYPHLPACCGEPTCVEYP